MTPGSNELLFTVSGSKATPVAETSLIDAGLTERAHLQEWVLAHPRILGDSVLIITFEFDQWGTLGGHGPRDRLDVLGLGSDGRLVLAELKRGTAPETVELQAIKYAAMTSRFTEEQLALLHSTFVEQTTEKGLTEEEALEKIRGHAGGAIDPDRLLTPRIVLLAEAFSPTVTSSVVWLTEQGLDITMRTYQAYRTELGETIVTVSQFFPVPGVRAFQVVPRLRRNEQIQAEELPEALWTSEDLALLMSRPFEVVHAILDLCSERPSEWVGATEAYERAGVSRRSGMGKLAGFGYSLRTTFSRSNPPWEVAWAVEGINEQNYRLDVETASSWKQLRADSLKLKTV